LKSSRFRIRRNQELDLEGELAKDMSSYFDFADRWLPEARDLIRATRGGFFCSSDNRASIACNVWGLIWCSIPSTS
jgi:hypothetical protein